MYVMCQASTRQLYLYIQTKLSKLNSMRALTWTYSVTQYFMCIFGSCGLEGMCRIHYSLFFPWKGSQVCQPEVRQHVCHGGRAAKICSSWNEWLTTTSSREEELISVISRLSSSLSARSSHLKVKHCSQIAEEVQLMTLLNGCSGDAHSSRHRTEELFENGTLAWKSNPGGTRDMAICRWDYGGHMWQRELMEFLWQMIPMWNTNRVLFPSSIQRAHEQRILFSRKCIISFCNTLDHSPQVTE